VKEQCSDSLGLHRGTQETTMLVNGSGGIFGVAGGFSQQQRKNLEGETGPGGTSSRRKGMEQKSLHYSSRSFRSSPCHAQLVSVTIRMIWLVDFSGEVVLLSLVQLAANK